MGAPSNRQLLRRPNKEFHKMIVLKGMSAIRMKLLTVPRQRRAIDPRTNSPMLHMSGWAEVHKPLC
jgi:hypothetical protein